eukprot:TRINITY_DN4812_c0_g1_i2.p1 TRINITY_DN4812_c0_g1~~TRINITY_DN4812_c0_g1_i2.p1  ORF type:complete len:463 (+),score=66.43 TRINITY_DN4812_c0_g1_i2:21-1409(+)
MAMHGLPVAAPSAGVWITPAASRAPSAAGSSRSKATTRRSTSMPRLESRKIERPKMPSKMGTMPLGGQQPRSPKLTQKYASTIFEDPSYGSYRITSVQPPPELKRMDWATAGEFFKGFAHTNGKVDKREFYRMLSSITRTSAPIDRDSCDRVFEAVNVGRSGLISSEEFLGWIFATCTDFECIRLLKERLRQIGRKGMQVYFNRIDMHTPGLLDRNDFHAFILRECPGANGSMSRQDCDEVFTYVDADKSGSIDLQQFVDWVYPEHATKFRCPSSPGLGAQSVRSFLGSRSPESTPPTSPTSPGLTRSWSSGGLTSLAGSASPSSRSLDGCPEDFGGRAVPTLSQKEKVVIEFDVSPELAQIGRLVKAYLPLQLRAVVQPRVNVIGGVKGCDRCTVWIGRGITLWDQKKMQQFVEDHFQTQDTAKEWVKNDLTQKLPLLLGVAEKEKEIAQQEVANKYQICR